MLLAGLLAKVTQAGSGEGDFELQAPERPLWHSCLPPSPPLPGSTWLSVFLSSSFSPCGSEDLGLWEPSLNLSCVPAVSLSIRQCLTAWGSPTRFMGSWVCLSVCYSYLLCVCLGKYWVIPCFCPCLPPPVGPPPVSICCSRPDSGHPPPYPRPGHVPPCSPCCSWSPASSSGPGLGARAAPPGSSRPAPCTVPPGSSCRPIHPLSLSPSSAAPCRCHPLWAQVHEGRPQPRSTGLGSGAGKGAAGGTGALDLRLRGRRGLRAHPFESEGGWDGSSRGVLLGVRENGGWDSEGERDPG